MNYISLIPETISVCDAKNIKIVASPFTLSSRCT